MKKNFFKKRCSFTLIELLLVMLVITILSAIFTTLTKSFTEKAKIIKTMDTINEIEGAVYAFYNHYHYLPAPDHAWFDKKNEDLDACDTPVYGKVYGEYGDDKRQEDFFKLLLGEDINGLNPEKIRFLKIDVPLDKNGKRILKDAWGEKFYIVFDANYNGEVRIRKVSYAGGYDSDTIIKNKIIVIRSKGPNKIWDNVVGSGCDDILNGKARAEMY